MNMMSTINEWDFPVELMPTPNAVTGNPEPDAFQVVRTDTNTVLGHHGSRYKLVPHDDVVNSIMDAVKNQRLLLITKNQLLVSLRMAVRCVVK